MSTDNFVPPSEMDFAAASGREPDLETVWADEQSQLAANTDRNIARFNEITRADHLMIEQIEAATQKMVEASKALVEAVRTQSQARALCEERLDSTLRTHEHIVEQSEMISEFRTKITAQFNAVMGFSGASIASTSRNTAPLSN